MTARLHTLLHRLSLALLVAVAACSGTGTDRDRTQREPPEALPDAAEPVEIDYADYETFDPAPYREQPPERQVELRHEVPERLMEGRAAEGITETIRGWRIQILSTADRSEADRMVEEAMAWWRAQQEDEEELGEEGVEEEVGVDLPEPALAPEDTAQVALEEEMEEEELPVYLRYSQPYYRVRLGDFARREEAEAFWETIRDRFSGAFVVPDMVTITR